MSDHDEAIDAIDKALSDPQGIMLHSWEEVRRAWSDVKAERDALLAVVRAAREIAYGGYGFVGLDTALAALPDNIKKEVEG